MKDRWRWRGLSSLFKLSSSDVGGLKAVRAIVARLEGPERGGCADGKYDYERNSFT